MIFNLNKSLNIVALAFLFLFILQCKKENVAVSVIKPAVEKKHLKVIQNINKEDSLAKSQIKYTVFIFPKKNKYSAMAVFKKQYSEDERYTILALNRLDEKNSWRADTLIIPNKFQEDFLNYSPFPVQITLLKSVKKFVYFSYPIQAFAVYENGDLKRWGPTSMGKEAAKTATGLHFTNWKSKIATSTVDSKWKLPFNVNIANSLGIGWHQFDLPGFPASHSCLRLLMNDAQWMYSFADQWILSGNGSTIKAKGIPVLVDGDYNWGGQKPWRKMLKNSMADYLSESEMTKNIQPFIDEILAEQKKREEVLVAES
jgi:lipoprotein-anchoring transpeptidase ErfK/SrfK